MFHNIGKKIQILAILCTILGCLISVAGAIACWCLKLIWEGFLVLIGGCLLSWVGSFILYGFGELIVQTTNAAEGIQNLQMSSDSQTSDTPNDTGRNGINDDTFRTDEDLDPINMPNRDECPSCFSKIGPNDVECPYCGYKLKPR